MRLRCLTLLLVALCFSLVFVACSGDDNNQLPDGDSPVDGDADGDEPDGDDPVIIPDGDVDGDIDGDTDDDEPDGDVDGDSDGDEDGDGEEVEWLALPIEPAANPDITPLTFEPYTQEFNHTIPESWVGDAELVAFIEPPNGYTTLSKPTPFGPRGYYTISDDKAANLTELPSAALNIVDVATTDDAIFVLTESELYLLDTTGAFQYVESLPTGAEAWRLVATDSQVYVLTSMGYGVFDSDIKIRLWTQPAIFPSALLKTDDALYLAGENTLSRYAVDADPEADNPLWDVTLDIGTPVAILADRTLPQALDLVVIGSTGISGFTLTDSGATQETVELFAADRLPLTGAFMAIEDVNGGFIVGAQGGAYRITESDVGLEYRVYVAQRWMPSGDLRDVLLERDDDDPSLFFATANGMGWATSQSWTMAAKLDAMNERVVLRHNREGALADSRLTSPGDLSTNIMWDSDNDGGWTCYWVLSECFRYKLTGATDAKANFDNSLARMLSFRTLTGTDYFLARSVIRKEGCQMDDCDGPDDGEWFTSPDGEWWVKADTSNDEVTSHMFMMGQAYDLCADEEQQAAIVAHVDGIIGGLVQHGYQLIDPQDDKCTSYGQFDPEYVNEWFAGPLGDGGRRSAQMIGALNLAYYLTGKQKYLDAKAELLGEHNYGENIANIGNADEYPFCAGSGDCDELAFQAFVPLLRYERDPRLREVWLGAWKQLYTHLIDQEDAFWDIANAYFEGDDIDLFYSKRWYERYPVDLVRYHMPNADLRTDASEPPAYYMIKEENDNFRVRSDGHIFPADERPNIRHNTPQFAYSGGWGSLRELDGGDAIYPYWLGRYYGFISDPE